MPVIAFSRIIIRFDNSMKVYCFRLAFEESYRPICSSNKDFNSKRNDTSWEMPPILFFLGQIKPPLYTRYTTQYWKKKRGENVVRNLITVKASIWL